MGASMYIIENNGKKIIAALLAAVFMVGCMTARAAGPNFGAVRFYDDFEGYSVQRVVSFNAKAWTNDSFLNSGTWSVDHRTYMQIEQEDDGNHYLRLGSLPGGINNKGSMYKSVPVKNALTIQFRFKDVSIGAGEKKFFLRNEGQTLEFLTIKNDEARTGNNTVALTPEQDRWYEATVIINVSSRNYFLYIDGKRVTKNGVSFPANVVTAGKNADFTVQIIGAESGDTCAELFLDDVRILDSAKALYPDEWAKFEKPIYYDIDNSPNKLLAEGAAESVSAEGSENGVIFAIGASKAFVDGETAECPPPIEPTTEAYVPLSFVAEAFGGTVSDDSDGNVTLNGNALGFQSIEKNNVIFIEAQTAAKIFNKKYLKKRQFIGLLDENSFLSEEMNQDVFNPYIRALTFAHPTPEQIMDLFSAKNAQHPRVMAKADDFARVRELIQTNKNVATWYNSFKSQADVQEKTPLLIFEMYDSVRINGANSRENMAILAFAYKISGEEKYLNRVIAEVENLITWPTWQSQNFLNLASITAGCAIVYDWLYEDLPADLLPRMEKAIFEKGLQQALEAYRVPEHKYNMATHWVKGNHNWNGVINGAMLVSALSLYDKYPKYCAEIVASAYRSMQYYLLDYYPDGASTESIGYWNFAMMGICMGLSASMTALGTDFELPFIEGFNKTVYFPTYLTGRYNFGYHDDSIGAVNPMPTMFFAQRTGDKALGSYRASQVNDGKFTPFLYDFIFLRDEFSQSSSLALSKDIYFRDVETGSMRSSWRDPNALILMYHAGENNVQHTQMDAGEFNIEALGERWIWDNGSDYATYAPTGESYDRYDLYRYRPEGNNCIVINPSAYRGQEIQAWNSIIAFESKPRGAFAVADLTQAYRVDATDYKRGYMLTADRTKVVIRDEITAKKPSEVFWSIQTPAAIDIAEDGKSAILTHNAKRVWVGLQSSEPSAVFTTMDAVPLPTSPQLKTQATNEGLLKLVVDVKNVQNFNMTVTFAPIRADNMSVMENVEVGDLASWTIPDGEFAGKSILTGINIDGQPYDGFDDEQLDYSFRLPFDYARMPEIEGLVPDGYKSVTNVNGRDVEMTVTKNDDPSFKAVYKVTYLVEPMDGEPINALKHKIIGAAASDTPQPENGYVPEKVFDGSLEDESRWSAENAAWLTLDLGENKEIDFVALSLFNGHTRYSLFEVYTSTDNEAWKAVGAFQTSGETSGFESYRLENSVGRYVRFDFHGNSTGSWNSVKETAVYALKR